MRLSGTWSLVEAIRIGWSELLPQEVRGEGYRHMDLDFFLNTRRCRVFGDVKEKIKEWDLLGVRDRVSRMLYCLKWP